MRPTTQMRLRVTARRRRQGALRPAVAASCEDGQTSSTAAAEARGICLAAAAREPQGKRPSVIDHGGEKKTELIMAGEEGDKENEGWGTRANRGWTWEASRRLSWGTFTASSRVC